MARRLAHLLDRSIAPAGKRRWLWKRINASAREAVMETSAPSVTRALGRGGAVSVSASEAHARPVACVVLSAERHLPWSERVIGDVRRDADGGFEFSRLPCQPAEARVALKQPAAASRILLVFVTPETVKSIARVLRALGDDRPPTLLVARGLRFEAIDGLLGGSVVDDFLASEFGIAEFAARVRRVLAARPAPAGAPAVCAHQATHAALARLVGSSAAFVAQVERIPTLASSMSAVLILGETGTGKELFARAIHYMSARASGPWIAVNCAALPAELVESELFGHARGAFTSAHQVSEGLIAQAEGGTLFLDEVDSLPLASQAKLLRFLQEREYRPLGAGSVRAANVRVVAASNADLALRSSQGTFRRDLFFRLAVLTLKLPTLRERPADIEALALHFVDRFACEQGRATPRLTAQGRRALGHHDWPGNVRELEHCIERAVLFCRDGEIGLRELELEEPPADGDPDAAGGDSFQQAKARVVRAFERHYIEQMLCQHQGNIAQAAAAASKHRRAFFELLRRHGIDAKRFKSPDSSP
jgi:two-component system response regulator GlrR